jgi:hypothetical protein
VGWCSGSPDVVNEWRLIVKTLYWLIDGEEVFNSESFEDSEIEDAQAEAKQAAGGNFWWVTPEPDLPRAQSFRHISAEDKALNRQGK